MMMKWKSLKQFQQLLLYAIVLVVVFVVTRRRVKDVVGVGVVVVDFDCVVNQVVFFLH